MVNKWTMSLALVTALTIGVAAAAAAAAEAQAPATVRVVVNYTGKGTVDATHQVWVWLFDTPDIGPGAMPIGQVSVGRNGAEATFDNVTAATVYIAAAYDESGTMRGDGPPPTGSPIGILMSATGAPEGVKASGAAPVTLTFDDSQRMP